MLPVRRQHRQHPPCMDVHVNYVVNTYLRMWLLTLTRSRRQPWDIQHDPLTGPRHGRSHEETTATTGTEGTSEFSSLLPGYSTGGGANSL